MNMSDANVNDVLNHCLELLDQGLTVEECLRRYPAFSEELAPLLQLAMQTQTAAETIGPSPEAQRAGLGRITDAWTAMQERQRRRERGPWRLLRRSWVLAAVAAMVLAFGGWTTAAAAQDSVPGEMLYPVKEARERVLGYFDVLEPETRPILEADGQVLAEDVDGEFDIPPLDNSAMDGYAVRTEDIMGASEASAISLRVTGSVAAGQLPSGRVEAGTAIRIMTGAPIPDGSDAVVPFEDTDEIDRRASSMVS